MGGVAMWRLGCRSPGIWGRWRGGQGTVGQRAVTGGHAAAPGPALVGHPLGPRTVTGLTSGGGSDSRQNELEWAR